MEISWKQLVHISCLHKLCQTISQVLMLVDTQISQYKQAHSTFCLCILFCIWHIYCSIGPNFWVNVLEFLDFILEELLTPCRHLVALEICIFLCLKWFIKCFSHPSFCCQTRNAQSETFPKIGHSGSFTVRMQSMNIILCVLSYGFHILSASTRCKFVV